MNKVFKDILYFSVCLLFVSAFLATILFMVKEDMDEAQILLDGCKERGYYGIKFEKVNFMRDKLVCTNLSVEEEIMKEASKE